MGAETSSSQVGGKSTVGVAIVLLCVVLRLGLFAGADSVFKILRYAELLLIVQEENGRSLRPEYLSHMYGVVR
jgi:hypothetical protein